jgi:hypothetical protein
VPTEVTKKPRSGLHGIVPPPYEIPVSPEPQKKKPANPRSTAVTLIAIYQLFRAGILLVTAAVLLGSENTDIESSLSLRILIYIVSRRRISSQADVNFIAMWLGILGIWIAALGIGLLCLQKWARRSLMGTSTWAILRLIYMLVVFGFLGISLPLPAQLVYGFLVLLDVATISSLLHEGKTFGEDVF